MNQMNPKNPNPYSNYGYTAQQGGVPQYGQTQQIGQQPVYGTYPQQTMQQPIPQTMQQQPMQQPMQTWEGHWKLQADHLFRHLQDNSPQPIIK